MQLVLMICFSILCISLKANASCPNKHCNILTSNNQSTDLSSGNEEDFDDESEEIDEDVIIMDDDDTGDEDVRS